jgi:hypothetical protein
MSDGRKYPYFGAIQDFMVNLLALHISTLTTFECCR